MTKSIVQGVAPFQIVHFLYHKIYIMARLINGNHSHIHVKGSNDGACYVDSEGELEPWKTIV